MFKNFINFIDELKLFFKSLDILNNLKNTKPSFVFFSENRLYQKFSRQIIDVLCSKYNGPIYYFSIDKNDKIENKKVSNYYINPLLMRYFFNNVTCSNLFLTLTDLGNNFTSKTKNVDNYIYYFNQHCDSCIIRNYEGVSFKNKN